MAEEAVSYFLEKDSPAQDSEKSELKVPKTQRLCGIDHLKSRESYIADHVNRALHTQLGSLSDIELYSLGQHHFGEQTQLLQSIQGSQSFGMRCFGMPRGDFIKSQIHRDLRGELAQLSNFSDRQLLQVSESEGDGQLHEFNALEGQGNSQVSLALGRVKLSRPKYVKKFIVDELQDQLYHLSDGAVFVLGNCIRGDQRLFLNRVEEADRRLGVSRSSWVSHLKKHTEIQPMLRELGQLTDMELLQLGKGEKKTVKKYVQRLKALKPPPVPPPPVQAPTSKQDSKKSILKGIQEALVQSDAEVEGPILIETQEDVAQNLTGEWVDSLIRPEKGILGVLATGSLLRQGHLEWLAMCSSSDEPLVVNLTALAQEVPKEQLFSELLKPVKMVSGACLKQFLSFMAPDPNPF